MISRLSRMAGCRCLVALGIVLIAPLILCSRAAAATAQGHDDYPVFKSNRFHTLVRSAVAAAEANQAHLATATTGQRTGSGRCRSSEFHCENTNHCIPLSKYCDRRIDCPDKSDEPASCSGEKYFRLTF